eukprot:PhM_4_TR16981/c0_g3_i1/m.41074
MSSSSLLYQRVFVVRHGERQDRHAKGSGRDYRERCPHPSLVSDPPLTATGCEQAARVAYYITSRIADRAPSVQVHTSPLLRCMQTAYPMATMHKCCCVVEPRACERRVPGLFPEEGRGRLLSSHVLSLRNGDADGEFDFLDLYESTPNAIPRDALVSRDAEPAFERLPFPESKDDSKRRFFSLLRDIAAAQDPHQPFAIIIYTHGFAVQNVAKGFVKAGSLELGRGQSDVTSFCELDCSGGVAETMRWRLVAGPSTLHMKPRCSPVTAWERHARVQHELFSKSASVVGLLSAFTTDANRWKLKLISTKASLLF